MKFAVEVEVNWTVIKYHFLDALHVYQIEDVIENNRRLPRCL